MADAQQLARIEHTILRPDALPADVHRVATEAMQRGYAAVVVAPVYVRRVAQMLSGSVRTAAVVAFPHGTAKATLKAIEATSAIKDGADQIEVVAHLPQLLRRDFDAAKLDFLEVVRAARATRRDVTILVILETALLMLTESDEAEARIEQACLAIRQSGCDGVVTSTGYHPAGGASASAVALLRKHAGELIVKAAGGITDFDAAARMFDAGADRVGLEEPAV